MQKSLCHFGAFFRDARIRSGLSLWSLSLRMGYHIRNLQRIEKGEHQPGVNLALRMLRAVDEEPGSFMRRLAEVHAGSLPQSLCREAAEIRYECPVLGDDQKSLFGLFLVQARKSNAISQTAMARAAGYNLRNINGVESGRQDPGIMTALALVMTTGVDVCSFFGHLYACWEGQSGEM